MPESKHGLRDRFRDNWNPIKPRAIASGIEIVIEMDVLRLERTTKSSEIFVDAESAA